MSYIKPSVLVYQDLLNSGGTANVTPDLEACIIGPTYNTLAYVPGSVISQIKTAAQSTSATTGYITSGEYTLTVDSVGGFSVDDSVLVVGAGSSGAVLQAIITDITGNVFTLDTAAGTTVTSDEPGTVTKTGKISNSTITNTFVLPGQKAGQVVDADSIKVWLNNAKVETLTTGAEGFYTDNTLTIRTNGTNGWTTGSISSSSSTLTLASGGASGLVVGDKISVAGAGAAGATLTTTIGDIAGDVLTLNTGASTTVVSAIVTKVIPVNLNSTTSTLRVEAGDEVVYGYEDWNSVSKTVTTGVKSVITSSAQNGTVVAVNVLDSFPKDMCFTAHGTMTADSSTLTIATETSMVIAAMTWADGEVTVNADDHGFSVGDVITITGVDPAGYNGIYEVTAVPNANNFKFALETNPGVVTTQGDALYGTNLSGIEENAKVLVLGAGSSGTDLLATVTNVVGQVVTIDVASGTAVSGARVIVLNRTLSVAVRKTYNNQQLPSTKPISGGSNFDTSSAGTEGTVDIEANSELAYGLVISGDVFMGYKALRTDLANRVLTLDNILDVEGQLGDINDDNPLALACSLALGNTTGRVRAIAIESDDYVGYLGGLDASEGERLYALVPLTQSVDVVAAFKTHVEQMSTPENASWRVALINTAMPTQQFIGQYTDIFVNANGGANNVSTVAGKRVLTSSNSTFISDGVAAGDVVYFTAAEPSGQIGAHTIVEVVSNQQLVLQTTTTSTAVSFYVSRAMSKTQSADAVAAQSATLLSKRAWHVQPDLVGVSVNGATKYLPGYYLCAAMSGMVAGFPVQQGFTNIGIAGITDLKHSNFYFSKEQLNKMAEFGTCLFVQESQGGLPYCRHELTTDVSVLEYREMLVVKNWDYLSYFYHDRLKSFIGVWNITPDTVNIIRQSIVASSELIKAKKLPKIGAPLLGYTIKKLAQNAFNKDNLDVELQISVVYPLNYLNLHLII